jgi:L-fucose mutarotase
MLKGIAACISPDLLKMLAEMGHGDEIVLADAHFPGHGLNSRVLRADGVSIANLLAGILPLFELDTYTPPLAMMASVKGDRLNPAMEAGHMEVIKHHSSKTPKPLRFERSALYKRARKCSAVVMTGDTAKYGNLILVKGVTPEVEEN